MPRCPIALTPRAALAAFALLASLAALAGIHPAPAAGQNIQRFLDGRLGRLSPTVEYTVTGRFREGVDQPGGDMAFEQHDLFFSVPIVQNEPREWSAQVGLRALDFHTDARLPDTGEAFPDSLWDVSVGTTYRWRTARGWTAGFNLSVGSASDEPFDSEDELTVSGSFFVRIPDGERNAWVVMTNMSNQRQFLRYVPLVGVGYWYNPGPEFQALLGAPVTSVRWQATDWLTLSALYLVPRTAQAKAAFAVGDGAEAYVGYAFDNQSYFRADRSDDDDQLTFYEQRVEGGLRVDLGDRAWFDVGGGYGFNRFWYEADEFDDRGDNRINLSDGPFAFVQLGIRF